MAGLKQILASGASVFYADHHQAGSIPQDPNLDAHIDLDANVCTALIIDKLLEEGSIIGLLSLRMVIIYVPRPMSSQSQQD